VSGPEGLHEAGSKMAPMELWRSEEMKLVQVRVVLQMSRRSQASPEKP
jgi:hypothetical protein